MSDGPFFWLRTRKAPKLHMGTGQGRCPGRQAARANKVRSEAAVIGVALPGAAAAGYIDDFVIVGED
jgi:hypothetical protein